jgi:hypothetical protein
MEPAPYSEAMLEMKPVFSSAPWRYRAQSAHGSEER